MQYTEEDLHLRLSQAKSTLLETKSTFVLMKGEEVHPSELRGVAPILDFLREKPDLLEDAIIADKVIGRAAALLLIHGKIAALHALCISSHALDVLAGSGIVLEYDEVVPYIVNRDGTDMCPMEKSVIGISDPEQAVVAVTRRQAELRAAAQASTGK
jgi:Domain of unknown function (DUF1893)